MVRSRRMWDITLRLKWSLKGSAVVFSNDFWKHIIEQVLMYCFRVGRAFLHGLARSISNKVDLV
jgi:hypothetical protein